MFRRRRPADAEWHVEDTAGRLGRALAQPGPHEDRIGHHRTQEGNTDASRKGLALVRSPEALVRPVARLLRLPKGKPTPQEIVALRGGKRAARA